MSFNDEFRMLSVSKAATDTVFGLIAFRRGERGEEIVNLLKQGLALIEYLEKGRNAPAESSISGDDIDPIDDYETLMRYEDGQFLFEHLRASKNLLENAIHVTHGNSKIKVSIKKVVSLQRLLDRIAMTYIREVSLSSNERHGY